MQAIPQDLLFGARLLLKQPSFTLSAISTLMLGIGVHTGVFGLASSDFVKQDNRDSTQPAAKAPPALTTEDVAAFFDGLLPQHLQRADIAGAVVAVVKDSRVLFARGYGYADVAAKRPVSSDDTLFRVASVSKLFTWTAVMQLVEQGKLDLDRDVNQYLDFQIPATYPQPITLRHLMTHTSGLQMAFPDHARWPGTSLWPLREYLLKYLPPRIFPPGDTPAYSNYGAALAGYIVQRVSGQPFEEYVAEHIFKPLGMPHSTFAQPLPAALKPLMSQGYGLASGPAGQFYLSPGSPSGGLSTTAADMARFMLAHLQDGNLEEARILKPETAQMMHSRQFGLHPSMNGMALGFVEGRYNDYRLIGHSGGLRSFSSQLYLVPSLHLGFFISQNSSGRGGPLHNLIWPTFFDRYFPLAPTDAKETAPSTADARALSGLYKQSLRFDSSILRLVTLRTLRRVVANTDGTIALDGKRMREVEPLLYRAIDGQERVAFRKNAAGHLEFIDDFPYRVYQRVPWYEKERLNVRVIYASAGVFALTLLLWPVAALTRRYFGRSLKLSPADRRIRLLVRLVCALNLIFLWAGYEMFLRLPNPALNGRAHLLQAVGIVGASGTLIVLYDTVRCWADRERWWFSKIHAVALSLACLGFVGFALLWHLFDFAMG